jgi:hypothetical protein
VRSLQIGGYRNDIWCPHVLFSTNYFSDGPAATVFFTLIPPALRLVAGAEHVLERALIFLPTDMAIVFAYEATSSSLFSNHYGAGGNFHYLMCHQFLQNDWSLRPFDELKSIPSANELCCSH